MLTVLTKVEQKEKAKTGITDIADTAITLD